MYVAISDAALESSVPIDLGHLRKRGFAFHHYRPGASAADHGELVFVCDLAKMVPSCTPVH